MSIRAANEISVEGRAPHALEVPEGVPEVAFDIAIAGLSIEGRVIDTEGRPVGGASIAVEREGERPAPAGLHLPVRSEASGAFAVRDLDPGPHLLRVNAPGYGEARAGPIAAGARDVAIRLEPGGRVRARVLGPDGEPELGAFLVVEDAEGRRVGGTQAILIGPGVEPEVTRVPPGVYTVTALSARGCFERRPGVRFDGGDLLLEFALGPGGTLEALARDAASGAPIEGARLEVSFEDGTPLPGPLGAPLLGATTGPDGVVRRPGLPAGRYRGRIAVPDSGRAATFPFRIEDDGVARIDVPVP